MAIDIEYNTFWLASQLTNEAILEVHLKDTFGGVVAGLHMHWRYAPDIMFISRMHKSHHFGTVKYHSFVPN